MSAPRASQKRTLGALRIMLHMTAASTGPYLPPHTTAQRSRALAIAGRIGCDWRCVVRAMVLGVEHVRVQRLRERIGEELAAIEVRG